MVILSNFIQPVAHEMLTLADLSSAETTTTSSSVEIPLTQPPRCPQRGSPSRSPGFFPAAEPSPAPTQTRLSARSASQLHWEFMRSKISCRRRSQRPLHRLVARFRFRRCRRCLFLISSLVANEPPCVSQINSPERWALPCKGSLSQSYCVSWESIQFCI